MFPYLYLVYPAILANQFDYYTVNILCSSQKNIATISHTAVEPCVHHVSSYYSTLSGDRVYRYNLQLLKWYFPKTSKYILILTAILLLIEFVLATFWPMDMSFGIA